MKKNYPRLFLFILFIYQSFSINAATFVVTSTADTSDIDGVSLRWALTQAVVNTGPDIITFNIPGPSPHTITLLSDLPQIIGYDAQGTVIDGSTQPANGYTGVSPKIIVDGGGVCMNGFDIEIADCEVYGLVITRFQTNGIILTEDFFNSTAGSNFIIGAPGKGNVIYNMDTTSSPNTNGISIGGSLYNAVHGGVIQSNKIGTDTSGMVSFPMYQGIYLYSAIFDTTSNILIGGGGAGEGNLISVQGANMGNNIYNTFSHKVTIKGNIIGANSAGGKIWGNTAVTGIYLYVNAESCTIGGALPGEGNIIAYNEDTVTHHGVGIEVQASDRCVIRGNSIYCNGDWGSIEMLGGNVCGGCFLSYAPPVITAADTAGASGTATPNDVVELFYNNTGCTHTAHYCSGETYIATVIANGAGNWSYTGAITNGTTLTATATSIDSSRTSAFAECYTLQAAVPPPVASFSASDTSFCQYSCISFTNLSQNNVINQWIFDGGFPPASSYVTPSPVCYDSAGVFDVTLIVTNSNGVDDTLTLHNYIHVVTAPPAPAIIPVNDTLFSTTDTSYTSYQWYSDSTEIPGATNSYLVISAGGNYNLQVTNSNGCKTATGISIGVGLQDRSPYDKQFVIAPNPVTSDLIISKRGYKDAGKVTVSVSNALGQILWNEELDLSNPAIINVKSLNSGVYFVSIRNERSQWIARFLKQ